MMRSAVLTSRRPIGPAVRSGYHPQCRSAPAAAWRARSQLQPRGRSGAGCPGLRRGHLGLRGGSFARSPAIAPKRDPFQLGITLGGSRCRVTASGSGTPPITARRPVPVPLSAFVRKACSFAVPRSSSTPPRNARARSQTPPLFVGYRTRSRCGVGFGTEDVARGLTATNQACGSSKVRTSPLGSSTVTPSLLRRRKRIS